MAKKIVIIGGGAGGASTAARLRRLDETAEIIILERGEAISYATCGLPYYIGGVIENRDELFVQTPTAMQNRFQIDVRVRHEVLQINRKQKEVTVRDLNDGRTYTESYDTLVLSPGAYPLIPNIPGTDLKNVFALRSIADNDRIKDYITNHPIRSAIVVGGGFIGVEIAENLTRLNLEVTLLEMTDQVMSNLDYEMAAFIHHELRAKGVELRLNTGVAAITETDDRLNVALSNGENLSADIIILAVGIRPNTKLAADAGLELGITGAILVNDQLQTSDPDIYAVGDSIQIRDLVSGRDSWLPLAGPANRQGRILADILAGRVEKYSGAQGTAIAKIFDLTAASTGLNEKNLKKWGIPYLSLITHSSSHAGYYPGASPLSIKLLFSPENGRLLGAQVVGYEGADKRIDVLATALRFGKSVYDLAELELAYAPPFSSAKDPVNIAGYAASNILNGDVKIITWDQLLSQPPGNAVLLDVREPDESHLGSFPEAINIPLHQLRNRLDKLPKDQEIVVYCYVGLRSYIATRILMQHGFTRVKNLSGGYKTLNTVIKDRALQAAKPAHLEPVGV
ncbi:MAG TPA: FAD-dependent oxidoreductase [Bacillota bacterium]|nr:FAD-dependent oxidoreductase [Bacillota bacterium]